MLWHKISGANADIGCIPGYGMEKLTGITCGVMLVARILRYVVSFWRCSTFRRITTV